MPRRSDDFDLLATGWLAHWAVCVMGGRVLPANLHSAGSQHPRPGFEQSESSQSIGLERLEWAHEDSNFGPRPYQGRALTN